MNCSSIQQVSQQQRVQQRRFNDQPPSASTLCRSQIQTKPGKFPSRRPDFDQIHFDTRWRKPIPSVKSHVRSRQAGTRKRVRLHPVAQTESGSSNPRTAARSDQTPAEDHAAFSAPTPQIAPGTRTEAGKRQRAIPARNPERGRIHPPGGRSRRDRPPRAAGSTQVLNSTRRTGRRAAAGRARRGAVVGVGVGRGRSAAGLAG